jgi:hypothetical protein
MFVANEPVDVDPETSSMVSTAFHEKFVLSPHNLVVRKPETFHLAPWTGSKNPPWTVGPVVMSSPDPKFAKT